MKTLFITCFHHIISKNILVTDVLRILADRDDLKIVIFVPAHKKHIHMEHYSHPNISFEGVDMTLVTENRINVNMTTVARLLVDSHYLWYKRAERKQASASLRGDIKYFLESVLTYLFAGNKLVNHIFRFVDFHITPSFFDLYFKKYNPDCIFATDIFDKADSAFIREAKKYGVRSVGMVRSWDNCFSKGLLRIAPDKILVNNDGIRDELIKLHDISPDRILGSVGLPQFDIFKHKTPTSWNEFCDRTGLDPSRRMILFSPAGLHLSGTDWQVIDLLKNAMDEKKLPEDIQFLIRIHPGRTFAQEKFSPDKRFVIDKPGLGEGKNVELIPDDVKHLFDSLVHSRVVLWIATTLGIDAVFLDKPQVVINFDGTEMKPYIQSIKRYHDEDHMKKMLDLGGMKVANSPEELINGINQYLENPNTDSSRRKKVVDQQIQFMDGRSAERVAQALLREIWS